MRAYTDGDRFGVETDPEDADLARATAETVRGLLSLADAAGLREDADGTCSQCGDEADVRPFAAADDDGNPVAIDLCGDCQTNMVERTLAADVTADETVDVEVGGEGD